MTNNFFLQKNLAWRAVFTDPTAKKGIFCTLECPKSKSTQIRDSGYLFFKTGRSSAYRPLIHIRGFLFFYGTIAYCVIFKEKMSLTDKGFVSESI